LKDIVFDEVACALIVSPFVDFMEVTFDLLQSMSMEMSLSEIETPYGFLTA
jgi:hypothetical protein